MRKIYVYMYNIYKSLRWKLHAHTVTHHTGGKSHSAPLPATTGSKAERGMQLLMQSVYSSQEKIMHLVTISLDCLHTGLIFMWPRIQVVVKAPASLNMTPRLLAIVQESGLTHSHRIHSTIRSISEIICKMNI